MRSAFLSLKKLKLMDYFLYSDVDFLNIDVTSSECTNTNTFHDWKKPNIWSANMHFTCKKFASSSIPMILTGCCHIRSHNYKDYASKMAIHIYRKFFDRSHTHIHPKLVVITTWIQHQVSFSFRFKFLMNTFLCLLLSTSQFLNRF